MPYLIHGATGAQGSPLFERLLANGSNAVAAVRDPAQLGPKPAIAIDMGSDSLAAAYRHADGVFVHLPMGPESMRVQYARNIVDAVHAGKPKRVVISTSGNHVDLDAEGQPGDTAIAMLVRGIQRSGVSHAVIATRVYLENLLLPMVFDPVKNDGVLRYPLRPDFRVSWCSHVDVAEVAERLLLDASVNGTVEVGLLPGPTGVELADSLSRGLERRVVFEPLAPARFGALIEPLIGPAAAAVVHLYEQVGRQPNHEISRDASAQQLLGIAPRSTTQWLAQVMA